MSILARIRWVTLLLMLAFTLIPAGGQAEDDPLCPFEWCTLDNCHLGEGLYWQYPGQPCESQNCQCSSVSTCTHGGGSFNLCYCLPCNT